MKKLLASIATVAVMLSPFAYAGIAQATAGVTVGNPAYIGSITDTYSNFTIIDTNNPVSANGWLSSFSFYAANTNPFEFVLVDTSNVVKWISPKIIPVSTGFSTYGVVVPVQAGWNLGVHFDSTGTIPFNYAGAPATYTPNNNGMPVVGVALTVEGTSNRIYSWSATGTVSTTCSTSTLVSGTGTQFKHLTTTDPLGSSNDALFTQGTPGAAVANGPDGFPGAWNGSANDPSVSGAVYVSDKVTAPSNPAGAGGDGTINSWRLFSKSFTVPAGAIVSPVTLHFAADNSAQVFLDNVLVGSASGFSSVTDIPLTVTPGTHELEFVVKNDAYNGATNPTGVIYKTTIDYCVPNSAPSLDCPAAPAVANAYLKALGIKPGSSLTTNLISQVAHHMGPQTDFDGIHACQTGYDTVVKAYVNTIKP
ncbi:MAG TPA: hypothetical protein VHQ41_04130 [Patescibacteria group bacterium]|jgi:hypothetical protein|nr:hypothetical protein [Patescibacteria group bacterium]